MNRFKLIIASALLCSSVAQAQTGMRFSVFANPLINWFQSDVKTVKSGNAVFGFDAGLTVDNYFAENYAFSSGISIGTLGGNLQYTNSTNFKTTSSDNNLIASGTNVKFNLQYITIPAGLKFKTKEIGYFTYFAHLGLSSQFNIKARASSDKAKVLDSDNISKEINFFNMGYHIGGGLQYSLGGNTALVAGITYTNGFIDITESDKDKITSSSLAIRLGILF